MGSINNDPAWADFGEGARQCLECGAPATIIGKASAVYTAPGRVLILKGDRLPDGAVSAVIVQCTNGHTYYLSTLRANGGGAT